MVVLLIAITGCQAPTKDTQGAIQLTQSKDNVLQWQLPAVLQEDFQLSLQAADQIVFQPEPEVVTTEQYQTSYIFPLTAQRGGEKIANLTVEFRHFHNGDVLYFIQTQATTELSTKESFTWQVKQSVDKDYPLGQLKYLTYGTNEQGQLLLDNAHSSWASVEVYAGNGNKSATVELPLAAIYTKQLRFGMVDVFTQLSNNVVVEQLELMKPNKIVVTPQHVSWQAPLPLYAEAYATEHWGVLSASELVDFSTSDAEDVRVADLDRFRKFRPDGVYYQVPSTYTPYAENAFWQVPAEHIGQRFINVIKEKSQQGEKLTSSYLESMVIASIYHNIQQQTTQGFWVTKPRSNWLYDDYGIEANFYDTRFSTDAAMFLLDAYEIYNIEKAITAVDNYAEFFRQFARDYSFVTENGGLLVQDYFHPTVPHEPTHVSLNHLVTEMNFLLMHFLVTGQEENLRIADKIRRAVHDTGLDWVKENKDLWYAYMPDGSYDLLDYPRLTRNDLRLSVQLIEEVWGEQDELFQQLIHYKNQYLQDSNIPVW